jgi:glucose/arabinose dehydrogenase
MVAAGLLVACTADAGSSQGSSGNGSEPSSARASERPSEDTPGGSPAAAPDLEVTVLADGLDHPWDVVQAPDDTLLVSERPGNLTAVRSGGGQQEVAADLGNVFADGETGFMGLALDPEFAEDRRFYTCQGVEDGDGPEIQVVAWSMAADWTSATRTDDPLLGGIPVNQQTGRHGGCRLQFDSEGALYVGTGDNADGENPQDLTSMAGKVLRIDPRTGEGLPDNPFADSDDPATQRIFTYGHRNVQGLALRPDGNTLYSVEHGPDRDDEVNRLEPGANYGWDPSGGGGYDESVPMTDEAIEGAVAAVWSSGSPTLATSGATFVEGTSWGHFDGTLLVGLLKDTGVLALRLDDEGALVEELRVPELEDEYGRIRSVRQGRDGALYVTTDNGSGGDQLLRVTPG